MYWGQYQLVEVTTVIESTDTVVITDLSSHPEGEDLVGTNGRLTFYFIAMQSTNVVGRCYRLLHQDSINMVDMVEGQSCETLSSAPGLLVVILCSLAVSIIGPGIPDSCSELAGDKLENIVLCQC